MLSYHSLEPYITPKNQQRLFKWGRVSYCFFLFLFISPLFIAVLFSVLFVRFAISIYLRFVENGEHTLCDPIDAAYAHEDKNNDIIITTFGIFKGTLDLPEIQNRLRNNIYKHAPNLRLTWKLAERFGFYAWVKKNPGFDITQHVKQCSEVENEKPYTEEEVQQMGETLLKVDHRFSKDRPMWEILHVPNVRLPDQDGPHFALIFRFHHAYADGLSLFLTFTKILYDQPEKMMFDPCNLPFKVKLWQKVAVYAQAFFVASYSLAEVLFTPKSHHKSIFQSDKSDGSDTVKFYSSNTLSLKDVGFETVKNIRKKFGCRTMSVFTDAITGALVKAAKRKGLTIPEQEMTFLITAAVLPYPNEDLRNRFTLKYLQAPVHMQDRVKRLKAMNTTLKGVRPYEILALYNISKLVGLLPARLIGLVSNTVRGTYAVSNVPGFTETLRIQGQDLVKMYGAPPMQSGLGLCIGVSTYKGKLQVGWIVEKSPVIENREDLQALVEGFQKEMEELECIANENEVEIGGDKKNERKNL